MNDESEFFKGSSMLTLRSIDLKRALANGVSPNARMKASPNENRLLICAVMEERSDIVELLLEAGADPNLRGAEGETPLVLSMTHNFERIRTLLLSSGADPNMAVERAKEKLYPIHFAAMWDLKEAFGALIQKGAIFEMKTGNGRSVKDLALQYGSTEVLPIIEAAMERKVFEVMVKKEVKPRIRRV